MWESNKSIWSVWNIHSTEEACQSRAVECMLGHFSRVRLSVSIRTVAHQAPLSMGFSRQEHWSGSPCPPPGDLQDPGIEPASLMSPAWRGEFFTSSTAWEAHILLLLYLLWECRCLLQTKYFVKIIKAKQTAITLGFQRVEQKQEDSGEESDLENGTGADLFYIFKVFSLKIVVAKTSKEQAQSLRRQYLGPFESQGVVLEKRNPERGRPKFCA